MITANQLAEGYAVNLRIIQLQAADLSTEDSLAVSPYNINSLNWVLGHIAVNRDNVLGLLDEEPLLNEQSTARYKRGSEPVTKSEGEILTLEELLNILQQGQDRINHVFDTLSEDDLRKEINVGENVVTLGNRLFGFYFHDTYHTGQTDLLRQVAGKNDQVIR